MPHTLSEFSIPLNKLTTSFEDNEMLGTKPYLSFVSLELASTTVVVVVLGTVVVVLGTVVVVVVSELEREV